MSISGILVINFRIMENKYIMTVFAQHLEMCRLSDQEGKTKVFEPSELGLKPVCRLQLALALSRCHAVSLSTGRLDRSLILLGLSVFRAPVFGVLGAICIKKFITSFSLPFSVLSLWDWPLTWKTIIPRCYYTVGWVI